MSANSREKQFPWLAASVALHALAFGLIVWFTPLRDALLPDSNPRGAKPRASNMTARQLSELAERIDDLRRNDMLDNVQSIAADLRDFEAVRDQMAANYMEFAGHLAETADDLLDQLLDELETQQQLALETMEAVEPSFTHTAEAETPRDFLRAARATDTLQQEAVKAQIPPLDTLDRALSTAQMAGMKQTAAALQALLDNQNRAQELQEAARQTNENARVHLGNTQPFWEEPVPENAWQTVEPLRRAMPPAQQAAKEAQQHSAALLQTARQLAKTEIPDPEAGADEFIFEPLPDPALLARMDTVDLYDTAVALEARILETYRDVRAAERAILARMSIQNARRLTDVARTERPEIKRDILRGDTRTAARLDAYKEALAEAVRETDGIRQSTFTLLGTVRQIAGNHDTFTIEHALEWGDEFDELAEAVTAEDIEDDYADLADYMRDLFAGDDSGRDENSDFTGELRGDSNDDSNGTPGPPPLPLTGPPRGTGTAVQIVRGRPTDRPGRGFPVLRNATRSPRVPAPDQIWGGRTIGPGGVPGSWLGVTAWHIIGPFPNPARANIDRKFPPETVVDLDAVYEGKNGPIAWEYYHSPLPSIVSPLNAEPYGIWYGYTELRFDRDVDLWVAIGSDDKSKVWVNDVLIWESAPQHKGWRSNEGFRRVHFRRGVNRVLLRCENGHFSMGWSFLLSLNPNAGE